VNKKGFTLIELMIGVAIIGIFAAIIGIFAAIAIPKFARLVAKSSCDRGEDEGCRRYAELTNEKKSEPVAAVEDSADDSKWEQVRGRIVKVQFKDAGDGLKDRWYIVIKQADGTIRNAMIGKPAVEDVEACVAMSPDEAKYFDDLVQCR
jgi:prepilin-type N-terminal cleavage/methylation domain-containing protein